MSRGDITDSVDVDMGEACLTTGGTARVIEGTTNRRSTALISTPSAVGQQHVSHVQPNNTNTSSSNSSNGSNNNNTIDNNSSDIHLTHFEEGYIINTTDNDNINNNSNNSNSHTNHSVHHTDVASDRHPRHLQQQQHHEIYIENDLFTLFNLCLTCRTFYAQAIRLLWRQRTLSTAHELKGFYDTLTRSLALSSRPKDALNQQQPRVVEAALRIKSLTLLDMCLSDVNDSFSPANWATTPSFVRQSFTDHYDSNHGRTNGSGGAGSGTGATHMHFRHRSNSGHYPQQFDPYYLPSDQDNYINNNGSSSSNNLIKWEHDTAAATSTSKNGSSSSPTPSALSSPARERASWAPGYSSTYGYDNTFWPSFSSSSSASTSQWAAAAAVAANSSSSRSHMRQKTTSIYSDIISPRLLHMVAQYCQALTDLTICIQSSELSTVTAPTDPSTTTSTASVRRQPTITFSFLAGALPSLRRLTLAGVVCDPDQNKTGSELLAFARTIQPLETLNIRSCQGISDETLIILAERSGPALERLDFQGMDFKDSEQLAKIMKSFVRHCPNLTSLTLSCMASLDLDESLQAFVDCEQRGASRLKELQILGHDHVVAQQQQQQQGMNNNEGGADGQQQPQEELQSVTTMCRLSDHVLLGLGRMPRLARLTLYCTGLTDLALIRFMSCAPCLEDLVLHEPTPVLHLPQLHSLTHYLFTHALSTPASTNTTTATNNLTTDESAEATTLTSAAGNAETSAPSPSVSPEQLTTTSPPFEYTSASFLHLVLNRRFRRRLSSLFIKISIETAQDWISQPVFQASGLASCLYQYQNAHSGEPAVVLIWRP
ncbi:hypothetical protein BGW42_001316 [Actinomortierella wolfii]|nr:hypothetical protein BGW42_001316 [Actinomortierella wolfii]